MNIWICAKFQTKLSTSTLGSWIQPLDRSWQCSCSRDWRAVIRFVTTLQRSSTLCASTTLCEILSSTILDRSWASPKKRGMVPPLCQIRPAGIHSDASRMPLREVMPNKPSAQTSTDRRQDHLRLTNNGKVMRRRLRAPFSPHQDLHHHSRSITISKMI